MATPAARFAHFVSLAALALLLLLCSAAPAAATASNRRRLLAPEGGGTAPGPSSQPQGGSAAGAASPRQAASPANGSSNAAVLLAFKQTFSNGGTVLQSWASAQQDPCQDGWLGVGCSSGLVTHIVLEGLGLQGSIPPNGWPLNRNSTFRLPFLQILVLTNNSIGGQLPPRLGLPSSIKQVELMINELEGPIPEDLDLPPGLQAITLDLNRLSSTVPPRLKLPPTIAHFSFSFNNLTGQLPSGWYLPALSTAWLNNNMFEGTLPQWTTPPDAHVNILPQLSSDTPFCGEVPITPQYFEMQGKDAAGRDLPDRPILSSCDNNSCVSLPPCSPTGQSSPSPSPSPSTPPSPASPPSPAPDSPVPSSPVPASPSPGLALPSLTTVSSPNYVAEVLESIGLSDHFRSGQHVAWYSGEANNPAATEDLDAHPGVFVAAVAERLGTYILRPPQHEQAGLANAQLEWLAGEEGAAAGWRRLDSVEGAQGLANAGQLVVAGLPDPTNSGVYGQVAVVAPFGQPSADALQATGPQLAQAWSSNSVSVAAVEAFGDRMPEAQYFMFQRSDPAPVPLADAWSLPTPSASGGPVLYLVDATLQGRFSMVKLEYDGQGQPTWALGSTAVPEGAGALTFPLDWSTYALQASPSGEPFSTTGAGSAWVTVDPSGALSIEEAGSDSVSLSPLGEASSQSEQKAWSGLWYALRDDLALGLFLRQTSPTALQGDLLAYDPAATAFPKPARWLQFSAQLPADGASSPSTTLDLGPIKSCTWAGDGQPACTRVGDGRLTVTAGQPYYTAVLEGLLDEPLQLQKASAVWV